MRILPTTPCQGLSVSFCFRDMAQGKVNPDLVINIIAGTKIDNPATMEHVIQSYRNNYWSDCADKAEELFRQFWAEGRIIQPRVNGEEPPNLSDGHWLID